MAIIDDLRSEVTNEVAVEMAAIVENRLNEKLAEKRGSLQTQLEQLNAETARVEAEIVELTPAEVAEEPQG